MQPMSIVGRAGIKYGLQLAPAKAGKLAAAAKPAAVKKSNIFDLDDDEDMAPKPFQVNTQSRMNAAKQLQVSSYIRVSPVVLC